MGFGASSERRAQHPAQAPAPLQARQQQPTAVTAPRVPQQGVAAPPRTAAMPPQQTVSDAKTIKNECAVVVESLQFDQQSSTMRWRTTCLVEADMEIHVAVRVDVMHKNAMITPNVPKAPPPRIHLTPGDNVSHEQYLDLSRCREQELTYIPEYPRQFPVVIVLFYKTQEGHHQAEFTMVQLKPTCKVVKQLIRTPVDVYKVEHLFGGEHAEFGTVVGDEAHMTSAAGVECSPLDAEDDGLCVICLTNEKNTVVMPCRHLCLCKECAEELRQRSQKCPVCRGPIAQLVAVRANSVSPQPQA